MYYVHCLHFHDAKLMELDYAILMVHELQGLASLVFGSLCLHSLLITDYFNKPKTCLLLVILPFCYFCIRQCGVHMPLMAMDGSHNFFISGLHRTVLYLPCENCHHASTWHESVSLFEEIWHVMLQFVIYRHQPK